MDDTEKGLNIVEKVFNIAKKGRKMVLKWCGDINDIDDTEFGSTILSKIAIPARDLRILGANYQWEASNFNKSTHLWSPIATRLLRVFKDIPENVRCDHDRSRLEQCGYVLFSRSSNGKTYAGVMLIQLLRSLADVNKPPGFMITGKKRGCDSQVSYIARSFGVDQNIDGAELAAFIIAALKVDQAVHRGKRRPIVILDDFETFGDEEGPFLDVLMKGCAYHDITFIILTQTQAVADLLIRQNHYSRIKALPDCCDEPPQDADGGVNFDNWVTEWVGMEWTDHRLLTELGRNQYPNADLSLLLNNEKNLRFLETRPSWTPNDVKKRLSLEVMRSPPGEDTTGFVFA